MEEWTSAAAYALSPRVVRRSLLLATVVGTVLSAANQGEAIVRGAVTGRMLLKVLFNYAVPFIVSSVSAAANRPKG